MKCARAEEEQKAGGEAAGPTVLIKGRCAADIRRCQVITFLPACDHAQPSACKYCYVMQDAAELLSLQANTRMARTWCRRSQAALPAFSQGDT